MTPGESLLCKNLSHRYALVTHVPELPAIAKTTGVQIHTTVSEIGVFGMLFLLLRAYSMGAGTYTGLEAVSNGIPILRQPRVETAKRTMRYMALSLSTLVLGLMLAYLLYGVAIKPGKTLNAILFESATTGWGKHYALTFIFVALFSEAALLFVAAQAGFIDGPRVLANMGLDRWFPTRFSSLSDRFVIQNGILLMGGLAVTLMIFTGGSVRFLVVLYSITVFITFSLSQLGMVRHWWISRRDVSAARGGGDWRRKLLVNGIGLVLTTFILVSMVVMKFHAGGWITLLITGGLVGVAALIKRHYNYTGTMLQRLNSLVETAESSLRQVMPPGDRTLSQREAFDPTNKTAVILVNGYGGLGLHTLFGVIRLFGDTFRNFVFVEVGVVDAGNFKGAREIEHLKAKANEDIKRYVELMKSAGRYAEGFSAIGVDVIEEVMKTAPEILKRFPNAMFFSGQLVFPSDSFASRILHNHTSFILQKRLYHAGIPCIILPIRL